MYPYEFVEVESTILGNKFAGCADLIREYAQKGYRYAGFIPVDTNNTSLQLVFEKETD